MIINQNTDGSWSASQRIDGRRYVSEGTTRAEAEGALIGQLTVVCAWCGNHMRGPFDNVGAVSHGICDDCADKMIEAMDNEEVQE